MSGSRDPIGGQTITSGDGYDLLGGPLGFLKALVLFLVVVGGLLATVWGIEGLLQPIVPAWAVLPLVVAAFAILVVAGTWLVFRVNEGRGR